MGIFAALLTAAVDPDVEEGLQLYHRLKYDRAVVALGRALTKASLPVEDRRTALETLGFSYTVLGDAVNAELTFHALLDLRPDYALDPALSPRLRTAFDQAKATWVEGRRVELVITSPEDARELIGEMKSGDPRRVGSVSTRDRDGAVAPLYCRGRECRGERPDSEFFVDLRDHAGSVLSTIGPFAARADSGPDWWVFAVIGAGAVAGAIAISFAVGGSGEPPAGSLGRLQLP